MALDPNIALQGRVPSLMQALQSGIQGAGALKQAPFIQQLLQQRAQAGQFQQQQAEQEAAQAQADKKKAATIQAGQFINRLTGEMINQSPEERQATVAQNADFIQSLGQDPASVDISDEGVNRLFKATSVFSQQVDPNLAIKNRTLDIRENELAQRRSLLENEAQRKGDIEEAKLSARAKILPDLRGAIKTAELEAKDRGETLTSLNQAKAAMPGLIEVVGQLKELAPIATSTLGGKVFDSAVKETGFGATKGSTAKAKFVSIVNNQVLPLLKQTFGAAFTENDRQSLIQTMGDPDASPGEKMVQLDSFIEGKVREIESKELELNAPSQQATPKRLKFNPSTGRLE